MLDLMRRAHLEKSGTFIFSMAIVGLLFGGCAGAKTPRSSVIVSNPHVGSVVNGEVLAITGDDFPYTENHVCKDETGSSPCMLIGFSFDVVSFEPGQTLACTLQLKADPADIPQFSAYEGGVVRREFVMDLQKISSPVIMKTMIQKDASDHGIMRVSWTCKDRDIAVVAAAINVDLGH